MEKSKVEYDCSTSILLINQMTKRKEQLKKQSEEWWQLYLKNQSLRAIAQKNQTSYQSVKRRLVRFIGKDYVKKAKSSITRSLDDQLKSGSVRRKDKEQIANWLSDNAKALAEIDAQVNNTSFYSEQKIYIDSRYTLNLLENYDYCSGDW